jgi:hypothetical protein
MSIIPEFLEEINKISLVKGQKPKAGFKSISIHIVPTNYSTFINHPITNVT